MSDKPDFSFSWDNGSAHVIRCIPISRGEINLDIKIKFAVENPRIDDVHKASIDLAIRHLLTMLPADYKGPEFVPGPVQESK